jgi:lysine-specific demethylase 8
LLFGNFSFGRVSEKPMENNSRVDFADPNDDEFPRFQHADYRRCVLGPGEMLYIPPLHWHYVRSLSLSFSVSFWWGKRRFMD